jgi:hypothetical protein
MLGLLINVMNNDMNYNLTSMNQWPILQVLSRAKYYHTTVVNSKHNDICWQNFHVWLKRAYIPHDVIPNV